MIYYNKYKIFDVLSKRSPLEKCVDNPNTLLRQQQRYGSPKRCTDATAATSAILEPLSSPIPQLQSTPVSRSISSAFTSPPTPSSIVHKRYQSSRRIEEFTTPGKVHRVHSKRVERRLEKI